MANLPYLTRCGLPGIEHIPAGLHACHFYGDRDELTETLVPYAVAGLRNRERFLWVTASPLPAHEATQALRAAWDGTDDAIATGALRILDYNEWYANSAGLKGSDVIALWLEEEERALAQGYTGLRITGNVSFLEPGDWPKFMEYEQAFNACFAGRRIVALCSYAQGQWNELQRSEAMYAHHCSLERPDLYWQVVPVPHTQRKLMAYRCYFLGHDGRIKNSEVIECATDAVALEEALKKLATGAYSAVEVWDKGRRVGKLGC